MSYNIVLSSSFCQNEYPNNHGCEFTNELSEQLDMDQPNESWSVALREITYEPEFWQNVREGFNECQIKLGSFNCFISDYYTIPARTMYLAVDTQFPKDPNESFSTMALMRHNKYEKFRLGKCLQ